LEIGNPVLTRHLPIGEFLLLEKALINQLLQLLLFGNRNRQGGRCALMARNSLFSMNLLLVLLNDPLAARCP
jgi:hypothetical protein